MNEIWVKRQLIASAIVFLVGSTQYEIVEAQEKEALEPTVIKKSYSPASQELMQAAKLLVKERLKDPESARFGKIWIYTKEMSDGTIEHRLCGEVNAKNGFGGYTGFEVFYISENGYAMIDDYVWYICH